MCTDNQSNINPFNKKNAWHTEWCPIFDNNNQEKQFILYKSNGSTLMVKKGDWVKIPGRDDKCIIDSKRGDYFVARTSFDSPDVDNEVRIDATSTYLKTGEFATIKVIEAEDFDLYGEVVL